MLRLFVVVIAFICCEAVPAGHGGGVGGFAPILTGGLVGLSSHINTPIGSSYSSRMGLSGYGYNAGPLVADGSAGGLGASLLSGPQVIDVAGGDEPVQVIFRSLGARVHVQQLHTPSGPSQIEQHRTEEEPHRVLHEIIRPVIQEVREVIQPYRRVTQEIRPVLEEVHTVVAKNDHDANGLAGNAVVGGHGEYSSSRKA